MLYVSLPCLLTKNLRIDLFSYDFKKHFIIPENNMLMTPIQTRNYYYSLTYKNTYERI